jgi:hypothetical protein
MKQIILNLVAAMLFLDKKLNNELNGSIQLHDVERFRKKNASFSIEYTELPELSISLKIVQARTTECDILDVDEKLQKIIVKELQFNIKLMNRQRQLCNLETSEGSARSSE